MKQLKKTSLWIAGNLAPLALLLWREFYAGPTWVFNIYLLWFWFTVISGSLMALIALSLTAADFEKRERLKVAVGAFREFGKAPKGVPAWLNTAFDLSLAVFLAALGFGWLCAFYLWHIFTMHICLAAGKNLAELTNEKGDVLIGEDPHLRIRI